MSVKGKPVVVETANGPRQYTSQTQAKYAVIEEALGLKTGSLSEVMNAPSHVIHDRKSENGAKQVSAAEWQDAIRDTRAAFEAAKL